MAERSMSLPDTLTLARLPATFLIAGGILVGSPSIALWTFALYILAALTDLADGWLARRLGTTSTFGAFMDALVDKVFVLGIWCALLTAGQLPAWTLFLLLVTLVREFLVSGLRMLAAKQGEVVPADQGGKWKAVCQMVALGLLLLAPVLQDGAPGSVEIVWISGIALLLLATGLTIQSGLSYFWKLRRVLSEA